MQGFFGYENSLTHLCTPIGGLAQLARVLAWHARGHGFESHILHYTALGLLPGLFLKIDTVFDTLIRLEKGQQIQEYTLAKFYTRKDNLKERWYVDFSATNFDTGKLESKRIFCPAKFKTKAQRNIWGRNTVKDINQALQQGFHFGKVKVKTDNTEELSIKKYIDLAIQIKTQSLRKKSLSTYTSNSNKFLSWLGDDQENKLDFITEKTVNNYITFLQNSEEIKSNVTINNILNITKGFFLLLKSKKFITENPFTYKKLSTTDNYRNVAFTTNDRATFEDHIKKNDPALHVFTKIMDHNFLRPKEIRSLKIRDIDFVRKTFSITGDVSKNRKSGTIPIHPQLWELLKHYEQFPKFYFIAGKDTLLPGPLQSSENFAYNRHLKMIESYTQPFEEKGYTLYSWRHSGAVRAYEAGTDIKTLQFLFRHSTIMHTEIYLKSLRLQLEKVVLKDW